MELDTFKDMISEITAFCAAKTVDSGLAVQLNEQFAPDSVQFQRIEQACHEAIEDGWMCSRGEDNRRYGRIIEPGPETHGFSVDVVYLKDIVGPHHRHPTGEIDMIMPMATNAKFDGMGKGWLVYAPDSAHRPTVSNGDVLILYLLPNGMIEFTGE